mgnify:FL=1
MKIKLCGIRRREDIAFLNIYKPDYAGFVFAGTKRRVTPEQAAVLSGGLSPEIKRVGVFVNETAAGVESAVKTAGLSAVQLHGDENPEYISGLKKLLPSTEVWKAIRVNGRKSIESALKTDADMLLFDSYSEGGYGGTGKTADIKLIKSMKISRPFFIAGGISAENISGIVNTLSPYGVDVSSGIETNGVKDGQKIKRIMGIISKINLEGQAI